MSGNQESVESGLGRITKKNRKVIGRLGAEWTVLDSVENLIFKLIREQYESLPDGAKRPPELVALDRQQREISERKRELTDEFVRQEEGLRPRRLPPGRRRDPLIHARNTLIRTLKNLSDPEICRRLDGELPQHGGPSLGLPENWSEKYGVNSYEQAYKHRDCRKLVQKLIAAAKVTH
jgi:hypothetical protein